MTVAIFRDEMPGFDKKRFQEAQQLYKANFEPKALVEVDRVLKITDKKWQDAVKILEKWPTGISEQHSSEKLVLLEVLGLRSKCFSAILFGKYSGEIKDNYFGGAATNLVIVQSLFPNASNEPVAKLWLVACQGPMLSRNPDVLMRSLKTMASCLGNHPNTLRQENAVKALIAGVFPHVRKLCPKDHEAVKLIDDIEQFVKAG